MPYQAPRGTHDILPGPADPNQEPDQRLFRSFKWQAIERVFRDVCARFGVEEIRTPIFEDTALFKRSVGEQTDIVAKETYDLVDRGGDELTLRPEGTAGVMRALVEHNLLVGQNPLVRVYYVNSHFRYERPQRGRYRQHHQVGVEYVGESGPSADVEAIALGMTYLAEIGLEDVELQLNSVGSPLSRPRHREALCDYLRPFLPRLSEDSQRRFETNPLRILDSKDERDQEAIAGAPRMLDYLDDESREHFDAVQAGLRDLGIPFSLNPRLVRGLDYYQRTAFEVVHGSLGSQNVVLGGGRYDGLVAELGGPAVGGIGFGSGIERALLILESLGRESGARRTAAAYLVARSESERVVARQLAMALRQAGLRAEYDLQGRSMKAQMRSANGSGCPLVVFVRDDLPESVRVKVMLGHDQERVEFDVARDGLAVTLAQQLREGVADGLWDTRWLPVA
ncbi:MAG: histidine--tRNA ligase [Armatimonadetes bacterium]|nr:histidine--tRNA ligase [Armatimonadota bacterium]